MPPLFRQKISPKEIECPPEGKYRVREVTHPERVTHIPVYSQGFLRWEKVALKACPTEYFVEMWSKAKQSWVTLNETSAWSQDVAYQYVARRNSRREV